MGIGDNIMATGMAKGAKARGRRIAFGDGNKIRWDNNSAQIFFGNPNIAPPGQEHHKDLEWIKYYKGGPNSRIYNEQVSNRWVWHPERFKAIPGEIFLTTKEVAWAELHGKGFIVIEPNVPNNKSCAPNKQWPIDRFNDVARVLKSEGHEVVQFTYPTAKYRLQDSKVIATPTFRHAVAVLKNAKLAILPEGGLHHAAAAVSTPAVVLFGGFIPPAVTGYDQHVNLTGGAEACGSHTRCDHCVKAMDAITVAEVLAAAERLLNG